MRSAYNGNVRTLKCTIDEKKAHDLSVLNKLVFGQLACNDSTGRV